MDESFDCYDTEPGPETPGQGSENQGSRPYIGISFECCNIYVRVYRKPEDMHYRARCPRCLREARLRVGPGGTSARMFRAF